MIVVDVETTGVDYQKCSILEIGAVDISNPSNRFYVNCQAKPGCEINDIALQINGHTKEDIYDNTKPTQREAIMLFDNWLKDIEKINVIGENPRFDINFLEQTYKDCEISPFPFGYRTIDLHTTMINYLLKNNYTIPLKEGTKFFDVNSNYIMKFVGIPIEPNPHNGLNGALWEAEAYSRLVFGKNLLPEFEKYSLPDHLMKQ